MSSKAVDSMEENQQDIDLGSGLSLMAESSQPLAQPVGPNVPQVAADTPCRKCNYNLRGLDPDSRCPECGTPVGLSLKGDLLRYSHPQWLGTIRRGATFIIIG